MNRFSNINWAAFFLGALWWPLWNRFWAWAAVPFVSMFAVTLLGFRLGPSGVPLTIMIHQFIMGVVSIYLALRGNRMFVDRIEVQELSPEEERAAKDWAYRSQRRQTVFGVFLSLLFLFAGLITLIPGISSGTIPFSSIVMPLITQVTFVVILLVLAPYYSSGKNELLLDGEVMSLREQKERAGKGRFSKSSKIALSALVVLVLFAVSFLAQSGVFTPERQISVENDSEVLEAIAGEYKVTASFLRSNFVTSRADSPTEIYTLNPDSSFSVQRSPDAVRIGIFAAERIVVGDIENVIDDNWTIRRAVEEQADADWYHAVLFDDRDIWFDNEILISIADDNIFICRLDFDSVLIVERLR